MAASLFHRGPDDSGTYHHQATGIGLAFRRLSILDISPQGHQPMASSSGRYRIVFNGEIYNFQEIRSELRWHNWRGGSDTEVMLQAFEEWGIEPSVKKFVGMFSFALWDSIESTLHLVRDRLGIKPLYYGHVGSDLVFASELKAIRAYPGFAREVDRDSLALYMRHNYVPSPYSIYKGIRKLQAGTILSFSSPHSVPRSARYWQAREVAHAGMLNPLQSHAEDAIEELHRLLSESVRLRMISDVPLGAFLSGGIDSSTVVALMQAQSTRPVKTFTIGFQEDQYNEAAYARSVAKHLRTDHTELYIEAKDALSVVPQLPAMYDEPFSDSSQIPTYLVSKLARKNVAVSLSGDGGDELFGGYSRYIYLGRLWKALTLVPESVRSIIARALCTLSAQDADRLFGFVRPVLPRKFQVSNPGQKMHKLAGFLGEKTPSALYYQALSHWSQPAQVVCGSREPEGTRQSIVDCSRGATFEQAMMLADLVNYLPDDILTKLDRASMAVSLEARVPLLDHRVVEFAWTLPQSLRFHAGKSKWILRKVLDKYVPPKLIERPKMGFAVPIDSWLRGPLREWAESLLDESRIRAEGFLDSKPIRWFWSEHIAGRGCWHYHLWDVLMFQSWLQTERLEPELNCRAMPAALSI